MENNKLLTPIQYLKGVGPKRADLFKKIGVNTVRDILWLLPRRYEDRGNFKKISDVKEGEVLTVSGQVKACGLQRIKARLNIFKIAINDGTGILYATFFNQPYLADYIKVGTSIVVYGKIDKYKNKEFVVNSPEYELLTGEEINSIHMGGIVPIYPATEGVNQKLIRTLTHAAISEFINCVSEDIPAELRTKHELLPLRTALKNIHFPEDMGIMRRARDRIIFEEFFIFQLGLAIKKQNIENIVKGISHNTSSELVKEFEKVLPYELTNAQKKVLAEIVADMQNQKPMNRLLQGDVGSGKTVVAIYALIFAIGSGYQAAIMVPTEILAKQHYHTIKELVDKIGVKVGLLISDMDSDEKKNLINEIANGNVDIIIGTHSLIQENIAYKNLGLIVIDEQHKFGVNQRALLGAKAKEGLKETYPDVLIMTATPIPRSLAITVYGDMDLSIIDELPPGRGKIKTYWITEEKLNSAYAFIKKEIEKGRQAFVVYPVIKQSQASGLKAAEAMYKKLQAEEFKGLNMALLHGRLAAEEKNKIMERFKNGEINILITTTVIEVGIDIPNATVMLIEHAERFGLAQLHQLRGRIGRGSQYSYCILEGNPSTNEGRQRLRAMETTIDGFKISEEDLMIRGPGEFFGTKQHGVPELHFGDVISDIKIMETAKREAELLLKKDPELSQPEYRNLLISVRNTFGDKLQTMTI